MIEDRLRAALRAALRARDQVAVSALRSTLGALDNATAVPSSGAPGPGSSPIAGAVVGLGAAEVPRRELTPAEALAVVRAEIAERLAAAESYGPGPAADRLRTEAQHLTVLLDD